MNLFYRTFGTGKPLVILHGLFGSSDNWQTLAKRFSSHRQVIVPDLRNHGRSPHEDVINYPVMANDIRDLITSVGLSSTDLIGHSMGGKTAMQFALSWPEMTGKLVVADIAPREYAVSHDRYIDNLLKLDLKSFNRREEADQALSEDIKSIPIRQFLLKNLTRDKNGKFTWQIDLMSIQNNLAALSAGIQSVSVFKKPALFIAGGKSDYIKPADLSLIKKLFPDSRFVSFENSGHWIHADDPERFYTEVIHFLEDPDE
jgi:esterase